MGKWIRAIGFDAFFFALVYAWKMQGIEGAGNIVMVSFWIFIFLGIVSGFACDETNFKDKDKNRQIYHHVTNLAWFFTFAYFGHLGMSVMWALSVLCVNVAKSKPAKKKDKPE